MQNQSEVAKGQLMGNLFVLLTSDLYKFALFSHTASVEKPNIQILHHRLDQLHVDNIMKLIPMSSGLEMPESMIKFFCETCVLAKQVNTLLKFLLQEQKSLEKL